MMEKFLEELPEKALGLGLRILLALAVFWIGVQLIRLIRRILKKSLERARADVGVIQFLDSFTKAGLYCLLAFLIASGFGLDAASVIAILGSAGVAIGLAIQGSLSNLAGGVLILLLKPFKVGDYIKEDTNGNEGTVTEIQIFYTKLTTSDNRIIVLPNGTLANASMTNSTEAADRRLDIPVQISGSADIARAREVLMSMLREDDATQKDKEMRVFVDSLDAPGIRLVIRCWLKQEDFWEAKWRLTEQTRYKLDEAGIDILVPQFFLKI